MSEFSGSRVLVVGLGLSGASTARALHGLGASVRVTDSADTNTIRSLGVELRSLGIEVEVGGHDMSKLDFDFAVVSPGIPPSAPLVRALEDANVEWFSEVELAYRLATCDLLAITGTNGKTTTTSLLAAILVEAGIPTAAAGNIGFPLIDAIEEVGAGGAIAVEVSSFQLEATKTFHPRVSVILNIAEDHTDWHGSIEAYATAKARIFANQTSDDYLVANLDDPRVADVVRAAEATLIPLSATSLPTEGIGVVDNAVTWRGQTLFGVDDIPLPGVAGIEDAMAASAAALVYGVEPRAVARAVKGFRPLAHRLEVVAEADDVTYIDDSKATNPHATLAAVRGLSDVVLIAGGRSKGMDLSALKQTVPPVIAVVAIGEARTQVEEAFGALVPVETADTMDEAVQLALKHSMPGGSVLLSPACASLDMYSSYVQRGEDFQRAVRDLIGAKGPGVDGDR